MDVEDLVYSEEAKLNMVYLFEDINDINFFVEDKDKSYEYETIFKRLFDGQINITKIFDVGGKPALERAYNTHGKGEDGILNFYIADGDFDRIIAPNSMIKDTNFIYLRAYNIENYFIDKIACEKFAKGLLKKLDSDVERIVNFDYWYSKIISEASELFFYYCYAKKFHPEINTLSRSPFTFLNSNNGFKDTERNVIQDFLTTLPSTINKKEFEKIKLRYSELYTSNFELICGKFLMDSLTCYIRSITKTNVQNTIFRWQLLTNFNIEKLEYLKDIVLQQYNINQNKD